MLIVSNLVKSYGERTLFSGLSFTLSHRDRIGIVGANGSGKTTLLDIIGGTCEYDSGEVHMQNGTTIGYLEQNLSFDPQKALLDAVNVTGTAAQKLEHKRRLIHDMLAETSDTEEQDTLMEELGEIEAHYELSGGYASDHEAKKILAGLGFKESDYQRQMREFSGGWIMRAGLAKLLLSEPDLLFLDEPTNHLDLEAVIWFENFLKTYAGSVLLISHDRAFLNRTITRIIALEPDGARVYRGDFEAFVEARKKERSTIDATIKNQERFIESEQRFINRFRAKNTKATQVQSRIRRLEKMERVTRYSTERTVHLSIPASPRCGKQVVKLDRVSFGYDETRVYDTLDLTLVRGEKCALVGPNGAGKSTLLKLLAGELEAGEGKRIYGHNVRPVYYAQHQTEQLVQKNTVLSEMRRAADGETDGELRTHLGAFLFSGDDAMKKVSTLSGGEQARLVLAKLFLHPSNLVLMDEPTNHLDIPSIEVLTEALSSYDGTLCLVTHDRDLINMIANRIIEVIGGRITVYHGNYTDYCDRKARDGGQPIRFQEEETGRDITRTRKELDRERKRREGELRNQFYRESKHLSDRVEQIEKEVKETESRIAEIERVLENPSSLTDTSEFNETLNEYDILKQRKAAYDDEWLTLSLKIETIRESVFGK